MFDVYITDMKRIKMVQTLATEREVFQEGKVYEIHDEHTLKSFLKAGIARLDDDPETPVVAQDRLTPQEKKASDAKVDRKVSELKGK